MLVARIDGVLVEPIGQSWVAFSPASGDTTLLNDESAAMLEVLGLDCMDTADVATQLAEDAGIAASRFAPALDSHWARLIDCGLIRRVVAQALLAA